MLRAESKVSDRCDRVLHGPTPPHGVPVADLGMEAEAVLLANGPTPEFLIGVLLKVFGDLGKSLRSRLRSPARPAAPRKHPTQPGRDGAFGVEEPTKPSAIRGAHLAGIVGGLVGGSNVTDRNQSSKPERSSAPVMFPD